jgi:DNA-binding transcriptional regulator PaaX
MTDDEILDRVHRLVEDEQELRQSGAPVDEDRMRQLEETLDQCWDLLRQRRAKREFGEDPDDAAVRDTRTVEGYQQ